MCRSHITFICFFYASEIPHIALWQNKSPKEKRKPLSCLLLQSRMAGIRTGITQQWRSVPFLSNEQPSSARPCAYFILVGHGLRQHKERQNLADDARMWISNVKERQKKHKNWMSTVPPQTHTSILAQAFQQEEWNSTKLMRDDPLQVLHHDDAV